MTWKPGQSGNPNGRPPRGESLSELIRSSLDVEDLETKRLRKDLLADKLVCMAVEGNLRAVELVLERVEGKVAVKFEKELGLVSMAPSQEIIALFNTPVTGPKESPKQ